MTIAPTEQTPSHGGERKPRPDRRRDHRPRNEGLLARLQRVLQRAVQRAETGGDGPHPAARLALVDARSGGVVGSSADVLPIVLASDPPPLAQLQFFDRGAIDVLDEQSPFDLLVEQIEHLVDRVASGRAAPRLADLRTLSGTMQTLLEHAERIAGSDASVLLTGRTGVGKEYLARALHESGPRADGPYVNVNCAALPENLLESQLFGHERGAFTGAERRHRGFFEAADGGTLMLDEIGELPLHLQVKLLTVLESREVVRIGSNKPLPIDVRVMAATNRDLERDVEEERFRSDLYFRLNVVRLHVPRLAERRQDVPALAGRFIRQYCQASKTPYGGFEAGALDALMAHAWPGNIRELHNVLERALLMSAGDRITLAHLPPSLQQPADSPLPSGSSDPDPAATETGPASVDVARCIDEGLTLREVRDRTVRDVERAFLTRLLQQTGGRIAETARRAGLRPRSLYDKMKQLDLRKEDFRNQT